MERFKRRYEWRIEHSLPVANEFFAWAKGLNILPKSPLGVAVKYALDQQRYLMNVFVDGRVELSNNRAERSIKPFVIGRKNWLFSATPKGAKASSVIYSPPKKTALFLLSILNSCLKKSQIQQPISFPPICRGAIPSRPIAGYPNRRPPRNKKQPLKIPQTKTAMAFHTKTAFSCRCPNSLPLTYCL